MSNTGLGNNENSETEKAVSEAIQDAIRSVVEVSTEVIEAQIRAGQTAAERFREEIAESQELKSDLSALIDGLVNTTREVGSAWLDVLSIVFKSVGSEASSTKGPSEQEASEQDSSAPLMRSDMSRNARTFSIFVPAGSSTSEEPPLIAVESERVTEVRLDLRPQSPIFVPLIHPLVGSDLKYAVTSVRLGASADGTSLELKVTDPGDLPEGTYTGVIVDRESNIPGGTLSVTIGP